MSNPSLYLENLIKKFSKLPGIGPKSASRLAFHILNMPPEEVGALSKAIMDLKDHIKTCQICGGISDNTVCSVCSDETRDRSLICIVEQPRDILTIEKTGEFKGVFHVLNGLISPLDGIGPDELNIVSLLKRCQGNVVKEVILALNPTIEGDATLLYLAKIINPTGICVTRIAHGLPVGADLEYTDNATIIKSIQGRVVI